MRRVTSAGSRPDDVPGGEELLVCCGDALAALLGEVPLAAGGALAFAGGEHGGEDIQDRRGRRRQDLLRRSRLSSFLAPFLFLLCAISVCFSKIDEVEGGDSGEQGSRFSEVVESVYSR